MPKGDRKKPRLSWRHFVLAGLIGGPALALGGVPPYVTVVFVPAVAVLVLGSIAGGKKSSRRVPMESLLMLGLATWTLLAATWLPSGVVELIAGPLAEAQHAATEGSANVVSVIPGSTRLEAAKWVAFAGLFAYCSWSRWRVVAALVLPLLMRGRRVG